MAGRLPRIPGRFIEEQLAQAHEADARVLVRVPRGGALRPRGGGGLTGAHACFTCCKSWKRPITGGTAPCPECGGPLRFMGRGFKAPRRRDRAQWRKVRRLYLAGWRFPMNAGPAAPLPAGLSGLETFIAENPDHPHRIPRGAAPSAAPDECPGDRPAAGPACRRAAMLPDRPGRKPRRKPGRKG